MKNYLKRNKPLLLLPLVLIPFVVLIFYVLGGGKLPENEPIKEHKKDSIQGANYKLPDADRNIQIFDKMEAEQTTREMGATHDYNILGEKDSLNNAMLSETENQTLTGSDNSNEKHSEKELNVDVSNDLLAHIRRQEQQARQDLLTRQAADQSRTIQQVNKSNNELKTNTKTNANTEKIHPTGIEELDRIFNQNISLARKNDSLHASLRQATNQLQMIEAKSNKHFLLENSSETGFKLPETKTELIEAEVYETTTVLTGNRIKLRLLHDCWLNGIKIPTNTFLYGICKTENERLQIDITQVPANGKFIPVEISISDLDGLLGLYVPDNASRKVAKEVGSSTNTSSMFGVTSNPLTYAGIQAADKTAQSLLKMIKIKKVTIKKNTLVYLINKTK